MAKNKKSDSRIQKLRNLCGAFFRGPGPRLLVGALIVLALYLGVREGWSALKNHPRFSMDRGTLSFSSCPPCVRSEPMLRHMRDQLRGVREGESIFDEDLTHRVQHELRASPWILDVKSVDRLMPDRLGIAAVYRRPAAVVQTDSHRHIIDRDGFWLPTDLYRLPPGWKEDGPVLHHARLASPPPRGRPWDGAALPAGARLTAFLREEGILNALEIATIDVTRVGGEGLQPDIVLTTADGVGIKWGTSDGYDAIEGLDRPESALPDREKLRSLRKMLAEHPGLEGIEYVDLRFNKIYYRPTGARPTGAPADQPS